jgi:hypothetical protein
MSCIFLHMSNFDQRKGIRSYTLIQSPPRVGGHRVAEGVARPP